MTRPTSELMAELRMRADIESQMGGLIRARSLENAVTEAYDRLSSILKAWEALSGHLVGRAESQYLRDNDASRAAMKALQSAITGTSTEGRG